MADEENTQNLVKDGTGVDELLGQTELGSFISRNRNLIIGVVVFLLFSVIGYGGYSTYATKNSEKYGNRIFEFHTSEFTNLKEKKMSPSAFWGAFEKLSKEVSYDESIILVGIESYDILREQKSDIEAQKVISLLNSKFGKKNHYLSYFLLSREAVVFEDLKKYKEAVSTLEKITTLSIKLMEAKTYLDLGRLYLKLNNKEKAKASFYYVVDNFGSDEFGKMAKIYLSEIE